MDEAQKIFCNWAAQDPVGRRLEILYSPDMRVSVRAYQFDSFSINGERVCGMCDSESLEEAIRAAVTQAVEGTYDDTGDV